MRRKLLELRREKDMSQAQFAEFLGISRQTVGFYESGERTPNADFLRVICERCHVSADWLLGLSENKEKNPSVENLKRRITDMQNTIAECVEQLRAIS